MKQHTAKEKLASLVSQQEEQTFLYLVRLEFLHHYTLLVALMSWLAELFQDLLQLIIGININKVDSSVAVSSDRDVQ